ncbi:MAG: zinc ribbon domain-containing protein [Terriglobia bacterium]
MFCQSCGKELPDDSRFCGFCGSLTDTHRKACEATLQAIERAEFETLDVANEIKLDADEACHMQVTGCGYLSDQAVKVSFRPHTRPDSGMLYVTNKWLRFIGKVKSIEVEMKHVVLSAVDEATIHVVGDDGRAGWRLATGNPMHDKLVAATIRKLASMARCSARLGRNTPPLS